MRILLSAILLVVILLNTGCRNIDGFEQHLRDAIAIYKERKVLYSAVTDGKSESIFSQLIVSEIALLPLARFYDQRAIPFIDKGIPIVKNDFVSMEGNRGFEYPFTPALPMTKTMEDDAQAILDTLLSVDKQNLMSVAQASFIALNEIHQLEEDSQVYFPMTKHLLESLGFGSLHGIYYQCQSEGDTLTLARDFAKLQLLAIKFGKPISLDKRANVLHQEGVGILVNDLPDIPFLDEYIQFQFEDNGQFSMCF
ncbi:hypothetical protein A9Q81_23295 [Gammaproteobacteria bacterium 42_54_T18]|nr:hypothetical protein A9Q81_23295 [Gammaproteobacteria bacterium 42_54_T18]